MRSYPTSTAAASLVGWVGGDGAAGGGLELLFTKQLEGKPGESTYERSRDGRIIPTGEQQITPAVPGRDVRLTIDSDLQWFAQNAIAQKVNETQALSGSCRGHEGQDRRAGSGRVLSHLRPQQHRQGQRQPHQPGLHRGVRARFHRQGHDGGGSPPGGRRHAGNPRRGPQPATPWRRVVPGLP